MTHTPPLLVRIDSSARLQDSTSRQLADEVEQAWRQAHPSGTVLRRDLALQALPHLEDATIQGFYTAPDAMTSALREATALSDTLIDELKSAHTLLISAPIYNFSIPSALKAWIDQVVRMGYTFSFDGHQFTGLVTRPRAVLALAYGAEGYQDPGRLMAMDHLRPYLTQLLGFLGIGQIDVLSVEGTSTQPETAQADRASARQQMLALFSRQD